jgi:D-serine deaminase-like pyridoxal phosphate-dependent protein
MRESLKGNTPDVANLLKIAGADMLRMPAAAPISAAPRYTLVSVIYVSSKWTDSSPDPVHTELHQACCFGKIFVVLPPLEPYQILDTEEILTPALLIYPDIVESNIQAILRMLGGDASRWRPHLKTAKISAITELLMSHGVQTFKCSTTLELASACEAGARDVLMAYPVMGANARRTVALSELFPRTQTSVLIESRAHFELWRNSNVGLFIDVNPGMDRTGIGQEQTAEILELAKLAGDRFHGIHYYDGHMSGVSDRDRERQAHAGYDRLLELIEQLHSAGIAVQEVITSGTPAAPYAISYPGFAHAPYVHRISPGTVVYNDLTSVQQLPALDLQPAALVLSTVVSHPTASSVTCDAGHKTVSADAGVPTCALLGFPDWKPQKPSEEHLPIEAPPGAKLLELGKKLYLVPRHVCPTVNNFDHALFVRNGRVTSLEPVQARGHEAPLMASMRTIHSRALNHVVS